MNQELKDLTPYINTDVKIPKKMLDALVLHETSCCFRGIKFVSVLDVKGFLSENFNKDFASLFDESYLLKDRVS
jgi:hypothetical protein